MMPLTLMLSHKLNAAMAVARRDGSMDWLRPDSKTQVTVEYRKDASGAVVPVRVDTVVISTQHADEISTEDLRAQIMENIVLKVIPKNLLDERVVYHIQPTGRFVIGGPQGDAGLTGRKIIVDTYGGWGAHGGGAFSGKDWSKVDRSAAYTARWIAKSLVAAGLARRCLVQLSYAIGVAEPLSIYVDTYGTGKKSDADLVDVIRKNWDLRPGVIGSSRSNWPSRIRSHCSPRPRPPKASIPQDRLLRPLWQPRLRMGEAETTHPLVRETRVPCELPLASIIPFA